MTDDHEERDHLDADAGDEDDLEAREAARVRRRDREGAAERDELMRPGMGKVFKQIQDSWTKDATADRNRAQKKAGRGSNRPQ